MSPHFLRIVLEEDIQTTLRHNYLGTRQLLLLARRMPRLAAFTHVSSTYSNIDLPTGATGEERVYPLRFGDREVDHADQVRAEPCRPSAWCESYAYQVEGEQARRV